MNGPPWFGHLLFGVSVFLPRIFFLRALCMISFRLMRTYSVRVVPWSLFVFFVMLLLRLLATYSWIVILLRICGIGWRIDCIVFLIYLMWGRYWIVFRFLVARRWGMCFRLLLFTSPKLFGKLETHFASFRIGYLCMQQSPL